MKNIREVGFLIAACAALSVLAETPQAISLSRTPPEKRIALINPAKDGELVVHPTFCSASVCFGAAKPIEGLQLLYREKKGDEGEWKKALTPPYFTATKDYRGSIVNLKEDTEYEIQVKVKFKGEGEERNTTVHLTPSPSSQTFRTWKTEVPVAKTVYLTQEDVKTPCLIDAKGSPEGWIRYTTKPGVVLKGAFDIVLNVKGAAYVLIDDLCIAGGGGWEHSPISISDSQAVRVRNCEFSGWGQIGDPRYDAQGRLHLLGQPARGYGINFDGAIWIGRGAKETVVERCYFHDPRGRANSWFYSHPAGPEAVLMDHTGYSTVIRYNDMIGSDIHRWNDAVESVGNFEEDGGFNRDADVYGNFMIFCNDDNIELDGGMQNVRCFRNRFEQALCGVSIQGCMTSPVYVWGNLFCNMGEEHTLVGKTLKTGGGPHGDEARAYVFNNTFAGCEGRNYWNDELGYTMMRVLRSDLRNNIMTRSERITDFCESPYSTCAANSVENPELGGEKGIEKRTVAFRDEDAADYVPVKPERGVAIDNFTGPNPVRGALAPGETLPLRPLGFTLSVGAIKGIKVEKRRGEGEGVKVKSRRFTAASTSNRDIPFVIRQNEVFDWFEVSPAKGVIPAGGEVAFTVTVRPEKMNDRHYYRGAFIVRTPEGLSRPVSIYAETDFVPPFKPEKPGEIAVYADAFKPVNELAKPLLVLDHARAKDGRFVCIGSRYRDAVEYAFDVPKDGRYYFLMHGIAPEWTRLEVSVDGAPEKVSLLQTRMYPTWAQLTPGREFGNMTLHHDLKAGRHTVRVRAATCHYAFDGIVVTDSPGSFEPR